MFMHAVLFATQLSRLALGALNVLLASIFSWSKCSVVYCLTFLFDTPLVLDLCSAAGGERTILGQSPTAEVLLERRASQRLPIAQQPTISEVNDGDESAEDEGQAAFRGASGGVFGDL